jgi:hypothetical protein
MTATMWRTYTFKGRKVVVIQQWQDPFGRTMVRTASAASGEDDVQDGMPEAAFLAEAVELHD